MQSSEEIGIFDKIQNFSKPSLTIENRGVLFVK